MMKEDSMTGKFLREMSGELQRERRVLIDEIRQNDQAFHAMTETKQPEREEEAQQERDWISLEGLDERNRLNWQISDAALARMEAGAYGKCTECGRPIEEERLRVVPTTTLCAECARRAEASSSRSEAAAAESVEAGAEDAPQAGRLPPDLEVLDDDELATELMDIVREDGHIDMEELQIHARNGVVYLEGAVPSEPEREVLRTILTDVAGVQEIVDNLEVQRLPWEREDRSKNQAAQDVTPGTIPDQEPYGGTEDVVLSQEEGLTYEPPENPPPPANEKS